MNGTETYNFRYSSMISNFLKFIKKNIGKMFLYNLCYFKKEPTLRLTLVGLLFRNCNVD